MSSDRFFALSPDLLATATSDGRFHDVNVVWEHSLGWTAAELRGRHWVDLVHPDDVARTLALRGGAAPTCFENRYRHKNGSYRWLAWSATPLIDGLSYLIARDVTEAKQTAASLAEREARLNDLFENALDLMYVHDLQGRLTAVNRAAERLTGYTRDELLHMSIGRLIAPEHLAAGQRQIEALGFEAMPTTFDLAIISKNGTRMPFEVTARLLYEDGRPVAVQGVGRDLTERRIAEREQRRLVEILDATTDLVAVSDADGRILYCNRAGRRMLGIGADEDVTTLSALDHTPPLERARLVQEHAIMVRDGVWSGETELTARDSRTIPISAVVLAHKTRSGRVEAYSTIARDITDRKRVEAELRTRSEALAREAEVAAALARVGSELISSVDRPVLLDRLTRLTAESLRCDASHVFLWDADARAYAAKSSYGERAEEREILAVTTYPLAVVAPLQVPLDRGAVANMLWSEAPAQLQAAVFAPFAMKAILIVALRRGNQIIGVLTAINRAEEVHFSAYQQRIIEGIAQLGSFALDNARLFEELERANRFRSDFVATMSHELRTPMSVILGYQDMLLEGAFGRLAPEQADTLTRAQRSAAELLDLVSATLDLSRMETRHIPLNVQEITVAQLLDDVADETALPSTHGEVRVIWQPPAASLSLRTDAIKARMVLKNLVGNAIKFTDRGSITVAGAASDGGVELTVSDTGIGIAAAQQQAIFEPFNQLESAGMRRGGAGLGLYIVKRLIDALGGTIGVESAPGKGATFRVWLPRQPARG